MAASSLPVSHDGIANLLRSRGAHRLCRLGTKTFLLACRVHESLRGTPAVAAGVAQRVWTIGDLLDAALATQPIAPDVTAPDRRRALRVIEGGKA